MLDTQRDSGSAIKSFSSRPGRRSAPPCVPATATCARCSTTASSPPQQLDTLLRDQPDRDLGAAGQPADERPGHRGPPRRRRADAGHLPGQRRRRLHRRPRRRHRRTSAWSSTPTDPPACTQGYGGTPSAPPQRHVRPSRPTPTPGAPLPRGQQVRRCAAPRTPRHPSGRSARTTPGGSPAAGTDGTYRDKTGGPFRRRTWPGTTPPAGSPSAPAGRRWCSGRPAVRHRPSERTRGRGCCSDRLSRVTGPPDALPAVRSAPPGSRLLAVLAVAALVGVGVLAAADLGRRRRATPSARTSCTPPGSRPSTSPPWTTGTSTATWAGCCAARPATSASSSRPAPRT